MRSFHFLLIVIGMVTAITVGWFYDNRPVLSRKNTLQIPDNIDYYLAAVKYRSLDQEGSIKYQLQSPYLEHFIREDRSEITQPDIRYFKDSSPWHIRAEQASLLHQSEQFTLMDRVNIQRIDSQQPMQLYSERIEFNPKSDTINIPSPLTVKTEEMKLQAESALMDMKHKRHRFHRVKSIYQRSDNHATS